MVSAREAQTPVRIRKAEPEDVGVMSNLNLFGQFHVDIIVRVFLHSL